MVDSKMIF